MLHFGQFVTFWADNVDQKCNNHVTKILLHFGSMSGIFLKKKKKKKKRIFKQTLKHLLSVKNDEEKHVYLSISSLNPHFQQTIILRLNILN